MKRPPTRRQWLTAGAGALGGMALLGKVLPMTYGEFKGWHLGNALIYGVHRLLLPDQALAAEYSRSDITPLPAKYTTNPKDETYQRMLRGGFADWRLPIGGLVARPSAMSLADLRRLPSRTQVTLHTCEEGWTGIAEWTGVQLSRVLEAVGMRPEARYVVFYCVDGWWGSIDMSDALHPQTLLAYGMNGDVLPVQHGAPVRLRLERQLGYKNLKYISRIAVTDRLDNIEDGTGGIVVDYGLSWYGGI